MVCWSEGHVSAIHDHQSSNCFVKVLDGQVTETMYHWPERGGEENEAMQVLKEFTVDLDQVTHINGTSMRSF